jgi:hypothetical protein
MARTLLRHIRVKSRDELRERILKWIEEIDQSPVVHRWKPFAALDKMIRFYSGGTFACERSSQGCPQPPVPRVRHSRPFGTPPSYDVKHPHH